MSTIFAFGLGVSSSNKAGSCLEVFYPQPIANPDSETTVSLFSALKKANIQISDNTNSVIEISSKQSKQFAESLKAEKLDQQASVANNLLSISSANNKAIVLTLLTDDNDVSSVQEAYLKLHLLSHRLVRPHSINLNGIFAALPNLAWTNEGPVDLDELAERQLQARLRGDWLAVKCVDKFPPMTDYIVPDGVRIAHTARVRLGAYVGAGTTIMHEGFINFNAGTAGASMVEGRISAGVFVGKGSDLGGGCSTMGTLSGGGDVVISIGENCLVGANAGVGIALGDRCTVEAGLYITAGSKVAMLDEKNQHVEDIKARELSGKSDLLFRRNSMTGTIECKTNKSVVELNEMLHAHN